MTGRDRSKEEPFFATGLDKMPNGIERAVRGIHGVIQRSPKVSPYAWVGSGYRPEPDNKQNEHRHGLAVDLIVTADTFLQQAQSALDSLMDTYKAQRSADKTYLAAFGLEDDPQPETIL